MLFRRMRKSVGSAPPRIAVIGVRGVGKGSTINALFNTSMEVSHVLPGTKRDIEADVEFAIEPNEQDIEAPRGRLTIVDMPGLGETLKQDEVYLKMYRRILPTADVILWILDTDGDLAQIQANLKKIKGMVPPDAFGRIVFGINKVDRLTGTEGHWLERVNSPDDIMDRQIKQFAEYVSKVLEVSDRRIVAYSALKRYRLLALLRGMLEAMPKHRRSALFERAYLQDRTELMDPAYREEARALFARLSN